MNIKTESTLVATRLPIFINWGAVIGGVAFALGIAWIMYLFGSAIGISLINPYSQDPTNGLGYGAIVWIMFTWLISLFLGGLLAGRLSSVADRAIGLIHGLLVWSICIVLTIFLGVIGITTLFQTGSQLLNASANTGAAITASAGNIKNRDEMDMTPRGINTLALENDIKQQILQTTNTTQNQQNNNYTQKIVTQLNNKQLLQVASYLLNDNTDAAKNVLALNTNLSSIEINQIIDKLDQKVNVYKQNIKTYIDKATDYTAGALWIILISNLLGLIAAIAGGWIGIYTIVRAHGLELR